jgi:hypothetical protein
LRRSFLRLDIVVLLRVLCLSVVASFQTAPFRFCYRQTRLPTVIEGLDILPLQYISEDKIANVLTEERFVKLSQGYEREQQQLQTQTADLAQQVETEEQKTLDLSRFLAQVRKHANVTELTPTMLNELVERIEVHAPDKSSGKRVQQIDVIFNFVGLIDELELAKHGK